MYLRTDHTPFVSDVILLDYIPIITFKCSMSHSPCKVTSTKHYGIRHSIISKEKPIGYIRLLGQMLQL